MRKILILGLFSLVGCTAQEPPKVELSRSSEAVPYEQKSYEESDAAANLDFIQLTEITIKNLSGMQVTYNPDATEVKLIPNEVATDAKFIPFNNWKSVKVVRRLDSKNWHHFIVEVFSASGYDQSKSSAFSICKDVWKKVDNRIPTVIDELEMRLNEYEKTGSAPRTQHIKYGYIFDIDASHYKDGYPIVCTIAYDKN
ncbi:hypothetical protein [Acinetobacter johnsonii]|uniref:hypothetical protein n=1 Tax=Acinetobacter johnsonii TaxID=40214 RepID=UPI00103CA47E|nr:hypothetical protein [Acinetobacter johnsonii]QBK70693.1 hypothetical protein E0Z08_14725 [Acinetobacter johnsonii]